jgi:hypothetical protein
VLNNCIDNVNVLVFWATREDWLIDCFYTLILLGLRATREDWLID